MCQLHLPHILSFFLLVFVLNEKRPGSTTVFNITDSSSVLMPMLVIYFFSAKWFLAIVNTRWHIFYFCSSLINFCFNVVKHLLWTTTGRHIVMSPPKKNIFHSFFKDPSFLKWKYREKRWISRTALHLELLKNSQIFQRENSNIDVPPIG